MVISFGAWYKVEGTLDIHSINTYRRETFYWLSILFTFAMGTAVGDGISEAAAIGYGPTFGIFVGAIILLSGLWYFKVTGPILSFWLVYIMTRPLGASLGDLLSSPMSDIATVITPPMHNATAHIITPTYMPTSFPTMVVQQGGGARMGYGYTSLLFCGIMFILTTWMTVSKYDQLKSLHTVELEIVPQVDKEVLEV